MIRFAFLVVFVFSIVSGFSQDKQLIAWKEGERLSWNDFTKKRSNNSSGLQALTTAGIGVEFECNGPQPKVLVTCHFKKKESWTRNTESAELLAHEQLHFDITELFARKLRKKLSELSDPCGKGSSKVQGIYDGNFKSLNEYQTRYDKQTKHGLNEKEQAEWIAKISAELKELELFASK